MTQRHQRIAGFTMLEMSVVLGIIALIAGAGINMAAGAIKAADRVTTQERLNTIKLALDSFGKTYGYLPCPADRTKTPRSSGFGVAATTCIVTGAGFEVDGTVGGPFIAIGAVPVRTLGLPDTYAGDAWGNKMSYAVTIKLTADPTSYASADGAINVKYGTKTASNFAQSTHRLIPSITATTNSGGLIKLTVSSLGNLSDGDIVQFKGTTNGTTSASGSYKVQSLNVGAKTFELVGSDCSSGSCTSTSVEWEETGAGAAYIVISHGPDGRGAYPLSDAAIPSNKNCNNSGTPNSSPAPCRDNTSTNCIDIENCQTGGALDVTFFDTTYNDGATDTYYFDDYVVWGSNAGYRAPIYTNLYIGTSTIPICPSGTCQAWCAKCISNYPGTGSGPSANFPPTGGGDVMSNGTLTALCKKVIYSDKSKCEASCFWSGLDSTTNYYRCP